MNTLYLILMGLLFLSCGEYELTKKPDKETEEQQKIWEKETRETLYQTDSGFDGSRSGDGGEVIQVVTCNQPLQLDQFYPEVHEMYSLLRQSDNLYIQYGRCYQLSCPAGYKMPRENILEMIKVNMLLNLGSNDRIWIDLRANTYFAAGMGELAPTESTNTDGYSVEAYLICLKESAVEPLY